MKKLVFSMMFIGAFLTGCEPMEDLHEEIDATLEVNSVSGDLEYTLTEEDYEGDVEDGGLGLSHANFGSLSEAQNLVPVYLSNRYPVWGAGSTAYVTFDVYEPVDYPSEVITYEVTTEDYDANPETERFNNFDAMSQVYDFLDSKYPDIENNTLVALTYKYYDGFAQTLTNGFLYVDGEWQMVTGITPDEYTAMGEGFPNFSSVEEAEQKLPVFLNDKMKYSNPEVGQIEPILFQYYDGQTNSEVLYFIYDGNNWSLYDDLMTYTLQFGYDIGEDGEGFWFTDNTINYTLTPSDYAFIGDAFADIYDDPAWSAGNYNNFDRRPGNRNEWTDAMILEAMIALLEGKLAPDAEDGQKYVLSYAIYNGSAGVESTSLIKENGEWVLNN